MDEGQPMPQDIVIKEIERLFDETLKSLRTKTSLEKFIEKILRKQ